MRRLQMTQALFLGLLALALASAGTLPASAAEDPSDSPTSNNTLATAEGSTESAVETSGDIGAASTCEAIAECWDGSTVTCTGESTCSAEDSDCDPNLVRGYCEADGVRKYCPPCEDCQATVQCPDGIPVTCIGQNQCIEVSYCYAYCDGVKYWCSGVDPFTCPILN